jgi:hypothetical protein
MGDVGKLMNVDVGVRVFHLVLVESQIENLVELLVDFLVERVCVELIDDMLSSFSFVLLHPI